MTDSVNRLYTAPSFLALALTFHHLSYGMGVGVDTLVCRAYPVYHTETKREWCRNVVVTVRTSTGIAN